jgi:hypothetical protein
MTAPTNTKQVRASQIQLDDLVLSNMGYWNRIVGIDRDPANHSITFIGEEIKSKKRAELWADFDDLRTVAA